MIARRGGWRVGNRYHVPNKIVTCVRVIYDQHRMLYFVVMTPVMKGRIAAYNQQPNGTVLKQRARTAAHASCGTSSQDDETLKKKSSDRIAHDGHRDHVYFHRYKVIPELQTGREYGSEEETN